MKKKYLIPILLFFLLSCNDEFMNRYPTDAINEQNFWHNENELAIYCNSLYPFIVGHNTGQKLSPLLVGDDQSDNEAPLSYNLIAAGEHFVPNTGGGWDWSFIRSCNYFLRRYNKTPVNQAIKDKYAGEIKFFLAWEYFEKVKRFGDVPWLNKDLATDSPELYAARDSRQLVMDSVLACLNWAIQKLPAKAKAAGRIDSDIALALKARICLHEGTFRKYHGITGANKFLNEAFNASGTLITNGNYKLFSTGKYSSDYRTIFSTLDLKGNPEMILYKAYEFTLLGNRTSNFLEGYSGGGFDDGVTKSLVDSYLCTDGKPISQSSVFLGHDSIQAEMQNRDPRLMQTVCYPGVALLKNTLPNIPGSGMSNSVFIPTGYRILKYWVDDPEEYMRFERGILDAPIFRFAEILLIYAEAAAELGQCDQIILDKTINKLRDRVGMPHMIISKLVKDPLSDFPALPVLIDEIRRERRVELAIENFRYDDLMRWKSGKLLEKPVLGMKFVQKQYPKVVVGKNIYLRVC